MATATTRPHRGDGQASARSTFPEDVGDFRLLSRRAAAGAAPASPSAARFMKGLFAWMGFRSIGVPFNVPPRHGSGAGSSSGDHCSPATFGLDGIASSPLTTIPLRVVTSGW